MDSPRARARQESRSLTKSEKFSRFHHFLLVVLILWDGNKKIHGERWISRIFYYAWLNSVHGKYIVKAILILKQPQILVKN